MPGRGLTRAKFEVHTDFGKYFPLDRPGTLAALLDGSIGAPFKRKRFNSVTRIVTDQGVCFLKRTSRQGVRSILRHLLRARRAHTDCGWEYRSILALRSIGLAVVEPVAYGEETLLDVWPVRGFLLVREVDATELDDLWTAARSPALRIAAMRAVGTYVGTLHGHGLHHSPRLHDFLYREGRGGHDMQLTMIDLDFKGVLPVPGPFSAASATEALAQSCFLFLRVGYTATRPEFRQFLRSYRLALLAAGIEVPPRLLRPATARLDKKLRDLQNSPRQRALFPLAPGCLEEIRV